MLSRSGGTICGVALQRVCRCCRLPHRVRSTMQLLARARLQTCATHIPFLCCRHCRRLTLTTSDGSFTCRPPRLHQCSHPATQKKKPVPLAVVPASERHVPLSAALSADSARRCLDCEQLANAHEKGAGRQHQTGLLRLDLGLLPLHHENDQANQQKASNRTTNGTTNDGPIVFFVRVVYGHGLDRRDIEHAEAQ